MGKTPSPGKWIKSLLGKKSSKSSLEKGTVKLVRTLKKDIVVFVFYVKMICNCKKCSYVIEICK